MRRSKVQLLDLIGAMDRQKHDVPTDIFSQGHEKPLDRGREKPLTYSARGVKSQPQISHYADLGNYQASFCCRVGLREKVKAPTSHPLTDGRAFLKSKALVLH